MHNLMQSHRFVSHVRFLVCWGAIYKEVRSPLLFFFFYHFLFLRINSPPAAPLKADFPEARDMETTMTPTDGRSRPSRRTPAHPAGSTKTIDKPNPEVTSKTMRNTKPTNKKTYPATPGYKADDAALIAARRASETFANITSTKQVFAATDAPAPACQRRFLVFRCSKHKEEKMMKKQLKKKMKKEKKEMKKEKKKLMNDKKNTDNANAAARPKCILCADKNGRTSILYKTHAYVTGAHLLKENPHNSWFIALLNLLRLKKHHLKIRARGCRAKWLQLLHDATHCGCHGGATNTDDAAELSAADVVLKDIAELVQYLSTGLCAVHKAILDDECSRLKELYPQLAPAHSDDGYQCHTATPQTSYPTSYAELWTMVSRCRTPETVDDEDSLPLTRCPLVNKAYKNHQLWLAQKAMGSPQYGTITLLTPISKTKVPKPERSPKHSKKHSKKNAMVSQKVYIDNLKDEDWNLGMLKDAFSGCEVKPALEAAFCARDETVLKQGLIWRVVPKTKDTVEDPISPIAEVPLPAADKANDAAEKARIFSANHILENCSSEEMRRIAEKEKEESDAKLKAEIGSKRFGKLFTDACLWAGKQGTAAFKKKPTEQPTGNLVMPDLLDVFLMWEPKRPDTQVEGYSVRPSNIKAQVEAERRELMHEILYGTIRPLVIRRRVPASTSETITHEADKGTMNNDSTKSEPVTPRSSQSSSRCATMQDACTTPSTPERQTHSSAKKPRTMTEEEYTVEELRKSKMSYANVLDLESRSRMRSTKTPSKSTTKKEMKSRIAFFDHLD